MPLSDLATIVVSTTGAGVTRAGFGIPGITSFTATWGPERTRTYTSIDGVGEDYPTNSPEYMAAQKIFGQRPRVPRIMILRCENKPTQRFSVGIRSPVGLAKSYKLRVAVATGSAWKSQDAEFLSGSGVQPSAWAPSGLHAAGDFVTLDGKMYMGLGKSSASGVGPPWGSSTGYGAASGPSGLSLAFREGEFFWAFVGSGSSGLTDQAVAFGLKQKVDALASPPVVGVGAGQLTSSIATGADGWIVRLAANQPGQFFGLQVYKRSVLSVAQDHADPGIATDLAACDDESNAWYGLVTTFNSEDLIKAAAGWVESASSKKLYPAATIDTKVATDAETASATDVAHDLKALAYARTWPIFHPSNDEFLDAGELGKFFPIEPGGETWRMKTIAGVTVESFTSTETTNLKAKFAHFYYDIGGRNVVGGDAKTSSGEYIDTVRGLDWYESELQVKLANLEIDNDKIPYTKEGFALVEAKIRQQNDEGIAAGLIAADPEPTIELPAIEDVSTEDKLDRELAGVITEWTLAGAIHHITVRVRANV